ncbi:MAG: hypothetical protein CFE24_00845 [Flavobacterium sp. BFFFF2]|nr:MAG: hypothetical protein CFE24_00845 [Flavobacterium sp. BFFFF2]
MKLQKIKLLFLVLFTLTAATKIKAQSTTPAPYCDAHFDDMQGFPVADAIFKVQFGTLVNNTNAQAAEPHYTYYNNLAVPNFVKGTSYNLSLTFDVHGGAGYGVWIDYNHNNIFETTEKVAGSTANTPLDLTSNTIVNQNIAISTTALTGNTRMRVRIVEDDNYTMSNNGYSIMPCNASASVNDVMDWGETEDYVINISTSLDTDQATASKSFQIFPNPVNATLTFDQHFSDRVTYQIINMVGQVMHTGSITLADHQIAVTDLAEGVYYLQLFDQSGKLGQQQFIKSRN